MSAKIQIVIWPLIFLCCSKGGVEIILFVTDDEYLRNAPWQFSIFLFLFYGWLSCSFCVVLIGSLLRLGTESDKRYYGAIKSVDSTMMAPIFIVVFSVGFFSIIQLIFREKTVLFPNLERIYGCGAKLNDVICLDYIEALLDRRWARDYFLSFIISFVALYYINRDR